MTVFSISCFLSLIALSVKTCHSISLNSFRHTLHLVLFDQRASHFLMFLGPRTVKQNDISSKPSDISPLPSGMPCPGASWRQTIFIRYGLLSRCTSFVVVCIALAEEKLSAAISMTVLFFFSVVVVVVVVVGKPVGSLLIPLPNPWSARVLDSAHVASSTLPRL